LDFWEILIEIFGCFEKFLKCICQNFGC
jgi:hypothetical protein